MKIRNPFHGNKKRKKSDTASLAAKLAPLEEQDAHAARQQGANGHGNGKGGLIQDHGALIFIAFIAWRISLMPPAVE